MLPRQIILLPLFFFLSSTHIYAIDKKTVTTNNKIINSELTAYGLKTNQYSSTDRLEFLLPKGLNEDRIERIKLGYYAVIVENNTTFINTGSMITIILQKKDPSLKILSSLEKYTKNSAATFLDALPKGKLSKWQPTNNYLGVIGSYETSEQNNKVSLSRALFIEAKDGFYVISLFADTKAMLNSRVFL